LEDSPSVRNDKRERSVFLRDVTVRFGKGPASAIDQIDPDEVQSESMVTFGCSVFGKLPEGGKIEIIHSPRGRDQRIMSFPSPEKGRYFCSLYLKNGANHFQVRLIGSNEEIWDYQNISVAYKSSFREWNETVFIAFFLALMIRSLVLQAFWIPTGSMEPTLLGEKKDQSGNLDRSGDRILVNRFAYVADLSLDGRIPFGKRFWFNTPRRGDIVVFKYPEKDPTKPPRDFIKRVVGLPGDQIQITDGVVLVNNVRLEEPYIAEPPIQDFKTNVPMDSLFVMGDNRNNSADSRYWGPMPLSNLKGQAVFLYLPLKRMGRIHSYPHPTPLSPPPKDSTDQ